MLSYKTRIGGSSFSATISVICYIFTQTKLSSIFRRKSLCLDEASRGACNSEETQTRKIILLGRDRLRAKSLEGCGKRESLKFLNSGIAKYIQMHPNICHRRRGLLKLPYIILKSENLV